MPKAIAARFLTFVPVATATFNAAAGGPGWVDTDVSATTGTDVHKLWVVIARSPAGNGTVGVRAHGETVDNKLGACYYAYTFLSYVDSAGHMDLYQIAAEIQPYHFVGYLV